MTSSGRDLVELEGFEVMNMKTYRRVVITRRFMAAAMVATTFSVLLFVIAIATPNWAVITLKMKGDDTKTVVFLGIWGEWREERRDNGSVSSIWIPHFPDPPEHLKRLADADLPHFYRTQAVFCVITLLLMIVGNALGFYCFFEHRYVYKRLTAAIFGLTAMCVVVIIETLNRSIEEWKGNQESAVEEKGSNKVKTIQAKHFGHSTILAWFVFAFYLVSVIVWLVASRKHKGSNAATQEFEVEDRPVNIGR